VILKDLERESERRHTESRRNDERSNDRGARHNEKPKEGESHGKGGDGNGGEMG